MNEQSSMSKADDLASGCCYFMKTTLHPLQFLKKKKKKRANICFEVVQTPVPVYLLESVDAVPAEEDERSSAENLFF